MTIAYKYCGPHGVAIIENLELKVTPPNQFNDPFEFTPRIICTNPMRRTRDILKNKKYLEFVYRGAVEKGQFTGTFREYRRFAKTHRSKMANAMAPNLPRVAVEAQRNCLDITSKRFGVLCLSNRRDSILMWGHYCDRHRGLVVGFDTSNDVFQSKNERGLRPVDYVRERVVFDASWKECDSRTYAFEQRMVFSKNDDWRYEGELRQLFELPNLKQKLLNGGSQGYFLTVPPTAMLSVTLGAKCPPELERKVRLALGRPALSHVKLDHAVLDDSKFALEFK